MDPSAALIANAGVAGGVLWYLLTRINPQLEALRRAIDANTRATLLVTVGMGGSEEVRRAARAELRHLGASSAPDDSLSSPGPG